MIRPLTCICMLAAAGSGLYLYQTKHRSQMLDREMARTIRQIDQTRDRIGLLKGEWALLSEPDRLNDLAKQHLALQTLAPSQFVAMADLGARLPAPLPPGTIPAGLPGMELLGPPATNTPMAGNKPAPQPRLAERTVAEKPAEKGAQDKAGPDRQAEKPVQVAALPQPAAPPAATPAPKPAARPSASTVAPSTVSPSTVSPGTVSSSAGAPGTTAAPAPSIVASATPAGPRAAAPHAMPPPAAPRIMAPVMNVAAGAIGAPRPPMGPIGESVARAARARESAPAAVSATASYAPAPAQQAAYASNGGSLLGSAGRVALPPPVPFGASPR